MSRALDDLIGLLTLERVGAGRYRGIGSSGDGAEATFGGHILGQATAAALATVEVARRIHSVHGYFLRPGRPGEPIDYAVRTVRDGRAFCTRAVSASQGERTVFELMASFATPEGGAVFDPPPPPDFATLPEPESLPRYHDLMATQDPLPLPAEWALREHGVDVRTVHAPWAPRGPSPEQGIRMWIRADGPLPDDPKLHAALLAYQSDESIADNAAVPFGVTWGTPGVVFASLDHALWYHRPFRMDEWLFVDQRPVTAGHGRGLATAGVWSEQGKLVASFTQEALIRF